MKQKKEQILNCSLELFNQYGINNVSQRRITNELKISPGNLTYHFKKRQDIETTLYFEMVSLLDHEMAKIDEQTISLNSFVSLMYKFIECYYEYRFIFIDFSILMRNNRILANHYKGLSRLREGQYIRYIHDLVEADIFRAEELPNEYKNLYKRLQLTSDYWILNSELLKNGLKKEQLHQFQQIILQSIYPYLTLKGKSAYYSHIS